MWSITEGAVCPEGKQIISYGISCGSVAISDISTNKEEIRDFVALLNRTGASEIHAFELVEDFLGK